MESFKKEKSCGAIIYKIEKDKLLFLILHMSLGHYSLCKGHVENDETEVETAYREIKEETSLDVIIDQGFREVITYSPKPGIMKDVVFFAAKTISNNVPIDKHDEEVTSIEFLSFIDAYNKLTYEEDKNTLKKAYIYLGGKEDGRL